MEVVHGVIICACVKMAECEHLLWYICEFMYSIGVTSLCTCVIGHLSE